MARVIICNMHFWWHVASEFALMNGWDMEQDYCEWAEANMQLLHDNKCYSCAGNDVTEYDIAQAGQGKATVAFDMWLRAYHVGLKPTAPDNACVLMSMHSGSSDYMFVKDVKEMCNG
jgi:hypothetical protein